MPQITINLTDEQVEYITKSFGENHVTVTDPVGAATCLLQGEIGLFSLYLEEKFDSGGNGLGDVFSDEEIEKYGMVEEYD